MFPKKTKYFINKVSTLLNKDTELVKTVVDFYYKDLIRKNILNLTGINIVIEELGTFKIKKKEVYKLSVAYKKQLEEKKEFSNRLIYKEIALNSKKVEKVLKIINKEVERKNQHLINKKMDLKKIWDNRSKILEGVTNNIFKKQFVEDVAEYRMQICEKCIHKTYTECEVPGTGPCCAACGCSLKFKVRSLSSECGLSEIDETPLWDKVFNEDEEVTHNLLDKEI